MTGSTPNVLDHLAVGEGPGVILIHGTGAEAAGNWGALIEAMSDRYRIVAPNLPGAGATPAPDGPLDLDDLVARVLTTARAAGLEHFHLVGHSFGAVIAAAVEAHEPGEVDSLVLHAGWVTSGPRERVMFELWDLLLRADPALLARELVLTAMGPDLLGRFDDQQLAELIEGFTAALDKRILPQIELDGRIDLRDRLDRISAPTLAFASAFDRIIPPHHQRELADAIAGARYVEVPGGHGLPIENPALFVSTIADFVDEQQSTQTRQ
jgi:pimeloyl-ACP methyl ester carboxylesterase